MRRADLSIGIDVGATKIHCGVVDADGAVLASLAIDPWQFDDLDANLDNLLANLTRLAEPFEPDRFIAIGVGLPGTVDNQRGQVVYTPNLRWVDLPLGPLLETHLGLPVSLIQDTGAAVWGEYLYGAGKGLRNVVCATIGSGLACGIIIDGRLYGGANHTAGEIGHLHVADESLVCGCGRRGCLEAGGSGLGLVKLFLRNIERGQVSGLADGDRPVDAHAIFAAAKQGDELCQTAITEMVEYLALGLSAVATILTPDVVIISGGLSRQRELLFEPLAERIYALSYRTVRANVRIEPAALGPDAPMVGAAALYLAPEYGQRVAAFHQASAAEGHP